MPSKRDLLILAIGVVFLAVLFATLRGPAHPLAEARSPWATQAVAVPAKAVVPVSDPQLAALAAAQLQLEHLQEQRSAVLDQFIAAGYVQKLDPRGLWVRPAFSALDYDDKLTLCALAYAYRYRLSRADAAAPGRFTERLLLIDSRSGRAVGYFSPAGLQLD